MFTNSLWFSNISMWSIFSGIFCCIKVLFLYVDGIEQCAMFMSQFYAVHFVVWEGPTLIVLSSEAVIV